MGIDVQNELYIQICGPFQGATIRPLGFKICSSRNKEQEVYSFASNLVVYNKMALKQ